MRISPKNQIISRIKSQCCLYHHIAQPQDGAACLNYTIFPVGSTVKWPTCTGPQAFHCGDPWDGLTPRASDCDSRCFLVMASLCVHYPLLPLPPLPPHSPRKELKQPARHCGPHSPGIKSQ